MTRAEHVRWAKERALRYVEAGEFTNGFTSMMSDLSKHPETEPVAGFSAMSMWLLAGGHLNNADAMRRWIEGFGE